MQNTICLPVIHDIFIETIFPQLTQREATWFIMTCKAIHSCYTKKQILMHCMNIHTYTEKILRWNDHCEYYNTICQKYTLSKKVSKLATHHFSPETLSSSTLISKTLHRYSHFDMDLLCVVHEQAVFSFEIVFKPMSSTIMIPIISYQINFEDTFDT